MKNHLVITGEQPFSLDANICCIVSPDAYTLNYSADGQTWTAWGAGTPAGENLMVVAFARGTCFKLVGNTAEAHICF